MRAATSTRLRETPRSLPIALLRAREAVMLRFRPLLAEHGFTEQQWRVLRVLDEGGTLDPTEIAERCVILTPSMTRILKSLEIAGHVVRANHPEDKRRFLISITEKARNSIGKMTPGSIAIYSELEGRYGPEKMENLLDMLEELAQI